MKISGTLPLRSNNRKHNTVKGAVATQPLFSSPFFLLFSFFRVSLRRL